MACYVNFDNKATAPQTSILFT